VVKKRTFEDKVSYISELKSFSRLYIPHLKVLKHYYKNKNSLRDFFLLERNAITIELDWSEQLGDLSFIETQNNHLSRGATSIHSTVVRFSPKLGLDMFPSNKAYHYMIFRSAHGDHDCDAVFLHLRNILKWVTTVVKIPASALYLFSDNASSQYKCHASFQLEMKVREEFKLAGERIWSPPQHGKSEVDMAAGMSLKCPLRKSCLAGEIELNDESVTTIVNFCERQQWKVPHVFYTPSKEELADAKRQFSDLHDSKKYSITGSRKMMRLYTPQLSTDNKRIGKVKIYTANAVCECLTVKDCIHSKARIYDINPKVFTN